MYGWGVRKSVWIWRKWGVRDRVSCAEILHRKMIRMRFWKKLMLALVAALEEDRENPCRIHISDSVQ